LSHPFHAVARGLSAARTGFWLALVAAFVAAVALLISELPHVPRLVALGTALVLGAGGLVVGFVGRCRSLAVPDDWHSARTRLRLAVLFEGCSLLSVIANFGVGVGVAVTAPRWMSIPAAAMGLSILLFLLGRVMFLRFARALSEGLGDAALARRAAACLMLFVTFVVSGVSGFAAWVAGNWHNPSRTADLAYAVGGGLVCVAVVFGLIWVLLYLSLLGRLRVAVHRSAGGLIPPAERAATLEA
jgi:hypothetical protein